MSVVVKMLAPAGTTGTLEYGGENYPIAAAVVEVPSAAVPTLLKAGYRHVVDSDQLAAVAANQPASTATDAAGVVADLNTLIASLKTAGLMAPDA